MAMAGQMTTEGTLTGQALSSSSGSGNLQLKIRSIKNTVLMYSFEDKEDDIVIVKCDILNGDLKLMERNWTRLVKADVSKTTRSEHMCLYELWEDDSLRQLKMVCKSPLLKGVILVNDTGKVESSFWNDNEIAVPLCIISSSSCEGLLDYFGLSPSSMAKVGNAKGSSTALVKISADHGVFNLECGPKRGEMEFFFPTICCRMLSQKLPCLQVIPESEEAIPGGHFYYVQEYQSHENLQHIHDMLAKNNLNAGIISFNVPEVIVKELYMWLEPPLYIVPTSRGRQLSQLLETLKNPRQASLPWNDCSSSPKQTVKVVPILGELQYANKFSKEIESIPFTIYSSLGSTESKYPPFGRTLLCANAKEAQSAKAELPFLVYYLLKNDEKDVDLFHAIHSDNRLQASGVIVINSTDRSVLSPSFYSDKKEAKKFPLPLIVVSSSCFQFQNYLKGNKGKVTLFQKEGKLLFGGRSKDNFDVIILNPYSPIPVPTDLMDVLFPDDNAVPQSLPYFRIVHHSEDMTYSTVFRKYEDEVKSGALIGFIVTLNGRSRRIVPPTNFFIANKDLVQIPVIGMAKADLTTLLHSKNKSKAPKQESEGAVGRIFKSVKTFFGYPAKFPISELLRSTEWDKCSPQMAYGQVAEKVKAWEQVSDKDEVLKILTSVLKLTGLRHLPVHILAVWNMRDTTMETDYLQAIYDAAKGEESDVLVQNIMVYKELVSQNRGLSYLLQATEHFVQKSRYPVDLAFWSELHNSKYFLQFGT